MNESWVHDFTNAILNESIVNIVACTRTKIWDIQDDVPYYVPARKAMMCRMFQQGRECMEGIQKIMGEEPLWYVFSASFGIVNPEWNMPDYAAYFGGPSSCGQTVSQETLEAQWADLNLSRYDLIVLWGPKEYLHRIQQLTSRDSTHFIRIIAPAYGLRTGSAVKELSLFRNLVLRELSEIYGNRLTVHTPSSIQP
ncbi:MAG TPA: hypothetical protein PLV56_00055 [Synergistales bacterium]|nr:hypothetical protein [Synergistales bacterium]